VARAALATVDDLDRLLGDDGPLASDSAAYTQAEARLEQASAIVRAYAGTSWLDDEGALSGVPEDIPNVVAGMVERASRNPAGVTQEQAGPFARSFGSDAAQRIYLSKMDKLVIRDAVGGTRTGIGTLSVSRGQLETADVRGPHGDWPEETIEGVHALMEDG